MLLDPNVLVLSVGWSSLFWREELDLRWPDDIFKPTAFGSFYDRSLLGSVVDALAEEWHVSSASLWDGVDTPDADEDHWIVRPVGKIGADTYTASLEALITRPAR